MREHSRAQGYMFFTHLFHPFYDRGFLLLSETKGKKKEQPYLF